MEIKFATDINGKPTLFINKIWQSLLMDDVEMNANEFSKKFDQLLAIIGNDIIGSIPPKKHTIRKTDSKVVSGTELELSMKDFIFTPKIKCISTQLIVINSNGRNITVSGKSLGDEEIEKLISNDGFDSENEFWDYFKTPFIGKIIHWTELRY